MKTVKIGIILLAFLLAAMVIVPMVNASGGIITSADSARAISAVPLPQLQVNASQQAVVVTGELSPGKTIQTAKTATPQITAEVSIPYGAIIRHANNITTVFDQNGNQVLTADDAQAKIVHTIHGDSLATFVHEVPNASVIVDGGDTLTVVNNNTRVLTIINANSNKQYIPSSSVVCYGAPYYYQWIEGTEAPLSSSSGGYTFQADWNVPQQPNQNNDYPVTIWNGLSYCSGDVNTALIQPVLQWNTANNQLYRSANQWYLQTWYVWSNSTPSNNDFLYATAVGSQIAKNDLIYGNIQVSGNVVTGYADDTNTGMVSELSLTKPGYDPEWQSQPTYAQIVLEGYEYGSGFQSTSDYLPGPVTFSNFILKDSSGNSLLSQTSMTSFVNSLWQNSNNFADYRNLSVYNQWPSTIALLNNPNRINPPVASFTGSPRTGSGTDYVVFQDQSTGSPFLWNWSFGDGSYSTNQNPAHYYTSSGSYTVNLTVVGPGGVTFDNQPNYIVVS